MQNETYSIIGWIASKYWNEEIVIESKNIEDSEQKEMKTANEAINNIEERAAAYNDIEPNILEICKDKLPILKSDTKWYLRIKEQIIKLFKILFGKRNTEEHNN